MEEIHRAIHDAVLEAGPKQVAHKMGTSHTSLLNRVNPNDDSHRLNVEQFFQVLVHTGDMRPLELLANAFGYDLVSREAPTSKALMSALMDMAAEVADVTRAAHDAISDGHVSREDKKLVAKEAGEAMQAITILVQSVTDA